MSPTLQTLEEENTIKERENLKILQIYQQLFLLIAYKRRYLYIFIFILLLLIGLGLRYLQYSNIQAKYSGEVTMFYSPQTPSPVTPLSLPQVLVVITKSQTMKQLGEEMGLSPEKQAFLGSNIQVEQLRNQKHMFKVHGSGPSRTYVQNILNTFSDISIRNYQEHRLNQLNCFLSERLAYIQELEDKRAQYITQKDALCKKHNTLDPQEELKHLRTQSSNYTSQLTEYKINLYEITGKFKLSEKKYKTIPQAVIKHARTLQKYLDEIRSMKKELDRIRLIFVDRNPRTIERQQQYDNILNEFQNFKDKNGITDFQEDMLYNLDQLLLLHTQNTVRMEIANLNLENMQKKLDTCLHQQQMLRHILPEYNYLNNNIKTLTDTLSQIKEETIKTRGCISHVPGELSLNERMPSTEGIRRFPPKILILIFAVSTMLLCMIITTVTILDIIYGKVCSFNECLFLKEIVPMLGVIPRASLRHEEEASILFTTLYYNVMTMMKNCGTIFSCAVDGVENSCQIFYEKMLKMPKSTISLCLMRTVKLDIIKGNLKKYNSFYYSNQNFSELDWEKLFSPDTNLKNVLTPAATTGYTLGDDNIWAYFPVHNPNAMSPEEIQLLEQTIQDLHSHYKVVVLRRLMDFKTPCILIKQLIDICDATILFVGKHRTPRRIVKKIIRLSTENHPLFSVLTNSSQLKRIARGDYF